MQIYGHIPYTTYTFIPRALDHFYTVMPYRTPGQVIGLTDASEPWYNPFGLPSGITNSFVWGSQNGIQGPAFIGTNDYNWPCARAYEFAALTNSLQSDRNENMALMLYALGHVLHLNQDLTSPDHARNDNHFSKAYIEDYGNAHFTQNSQWFNLPDNATIGWANWQAQGFNKLLDFWDRNLYKGNSSDALNQEAAGNIKLGLAEWSNGNFLGEDALYKEAIGDPNDIHYFPFPSLESGTTFPQLRQNMTYGVGSVILANGQIVNRIYVNKTNDGIAVMPHSVVGYLGAVYPRKGGPLARVSVSINDSNVLQEYHSLLLPKAVEYSTGILDYFFRGDFHVTIAGNTITIINTSGQDFSGGSFLLLQESSSGCRTQVDQFAPSGGTLPSGGLMNVTESALGSASSTTKFILVYQGTIGVDGSGNPLDAVDAETGIAARAFTTEGEIGSSGVSVEWGEAAGWNSSFTPQNANGTSWEGSISLPADGTGANFVNTGGFSSESTAGTIVYTITRDGPGSDEMVDSSIYVYDDGGGHTLIDISGEDSGTYSFQFTSHGPDVYVEVGATSNWGYAHPRIYNFDVKGTIYIDE